MGLPSPSEQPASRGPPHCLFCPWPPGTPPAAPLDPGPLDLPSRRPSQPALCFSHNPAPPSARDAAGWTARSWAERLTLTPARLADPGQWREGGAGICSRGGCSAALRGPAGQQESGTCPWAGPSATVLYPCVASEGSSPALGGGGAPPACAAGGLPGSTRPHLVISLQNHRCSITPSLDGQAGPGCGGVARPLSVSPLPGPQAVLVGGAGQQRSTPASHGVGSVGLPL